ncbi:putative large terminase subunit [Ralstonia phage phiRSP]|uniref:Terminase, large subunit n=1 Tax=Ralstonia phage phiRSP TaxID=2201420 RepID=A0A345ANS8_9CAUD|nr:terminase large subunit [Ralstonia phage phiRSP]AXF38217.1 putative large terminase subunit [Ralstonia phage phiRSP]
MSDQFSNPDGVAAAEARAVKNLVPPRDCLPHVWAEANIQIPLGNSAPGPIRFANAPPQIGMIDAIRIPGVRRISFQLAAQTGKTNVMNCIVGYGIDHDPRSMLFCTPTEGDMKVFLEGKLRPLLETCPSIKRKVAQQRGRDGPNNGRLIGFPGGYLFLVWAGSTRTLRGRSAPWAIADETDAFEDSKEGNPLQLLAQRTASFSDQALLIEASTPTVKGESNIEAAFLAGDQRRWWVPCPDCGEYQYFKWENVHWVGRQSINLTEWEKDVGAEHQPETAMYACECCGSLWDDGQRINAIRAGEWRAAKPFKDHASFHLPEMGSTFRRMRDIVNSYLDKIAVQDVRSFANVSLAETFEEHGDKADPSILMQRREVYAAQVPMGGVWLAAGIDAQIDRLEVQIVAFGVGEESWRIDYRVLWGDPLAPDVWMELEGVLSEEFQHESGAMLRIGGACIDTGGTNSYTQTAYDWLRGKSGRRIFGVKGVAGWGRPIVENPQRKQSGKNARKIDLFLVGVDEAKLILMRRLNAAAPGPGYIHFSEDADDEYFKQLTSEKLVTRYVKGFPKREWTKPDKARNEALDTFVYAYAALKILQPNLNRLAERLQTQVPREARPQLPRKPDETRELAPNPPANDNEPAEIPPNERQAPQQDNGRIFRSKRVLAAKKAGSTWATRW